MLTPLTKVNARSFKTKKPRGKKKKKRRERTKNLNYSVLLLKSMWHLIIEKITNFFFFSLGPWLWHM